MMRAIVILGALVLALGMPARGHAATCCIDGVCAYIGTLTTGVTPLTSLCGHTIYGTGTGTCTITMGQNESISSGTCVEMNGKTALKMNDHTISCTSGACDYALKLYTTLSTGTGVEGPGNILGCWASAAYVNRPNGNITDVNVDLATLGSSCTNTTNGFLPGSFQNITRVIVANASGTGIKADYDTDIYNSIVRDSGIGIQTRLFGSVGTDVNTTLIIGNNVSIGSYTGATPQATLRDSIVRDAGTCHFADYYYTSGTCVSSSAVINFDNTNFIDNAIFVNSTQVVP